MTEYTTPLFLKHRWAACANPSCTLFHHYKRVKFVPVGTHADGATRSALEACKVCGEQPRMKTWKGWAERERIARADRLVAAGYELRTTGPDGRRVWAKQGSAEHEAAVDKIVDRVERGMEVK